MLTFDFCGQAEALVPQTGHCDVHVVGSSCGKVIGGDAHGPECQAASAHDEDLGLPLRLRGSPLAENLCDNGLSLEDGIPGEQGARRQHGGHLHGQTVGNGHHVLQVRHDQQLGIAGWGLIERIDDHALSNAQATVVGLGDLRAQGLDDAGHLEAGKEGASRMPWCAGEDIEFTDGQ